jgi:hypothetical protein
MLLSAAHSDAVAAPSVGSVPVVTVTASRPSANEANNAQTGQFTISRSGGNMADPLTVLLDLGGTATLGTDYYHPGPAFGGSITIPGGAKSFTITIVPIPDNVAEGNESVVVTLQPDAAYSLAPPKDQATVTILDSSNTVSIAAKKPNASEVSGTTKGMGQFVLTRTGGSFLNQLHVTLIITGTATNGTDYTTISTTATFLPNQRTTTINITPIDDSTIEGPETVILQVQSGSSYSVNSLASQATVTIADDNHPPTFGTVTAISGGSTGTPLTITYADLVAHTGVADPEGQPITFKITRVKSGTLTLNGAPVVAGTTVIASGDSLVWTAAPTAHGTVQAFQLAASDGVNLTKPVTISVLVVG